MAYNANIPQSTDQFDVSQGDLLANFQAIETLIDVDHGTFGSIFEGEHIKLTMPDNTIAPTFGAGDIGQYALLYALTNKNELYVHKLTFAGTADIPATASSIGQAVPTNNSAGWTYLPSGIVMAWGTVTGNGSATFTLPVTCPTLTAIQSVQLTPLSGIGGDANLAVRLVSIDSAAQITVYFSTRTATGAALGDALVLIIGA